MLSVDEISISVIYVEEILQHAEDKAGNGENLSE